MYRIAAPFVLTDGGTAYYTENKVSMPVCELTSVFVAVQAERESKDAWRVACAFMLDLPLPS